ncbi:unnamed protein product [Nesidiocoris tenuis]|uniref:Uncharacterized protein n=1 Tax=Nesidiocoris tenuis TaxID=355587 RepID=A0A6H5HBF3_9HEMI|nr:unnamed protein product [Nesidiocoris tenuis]
MVRLRYMDYEPDLLYRVWELFQLGDWLYLCNLAITQILLEGSSFRLAVGDGSYYSVRLQTIVGVDQPPCNVRKHENSENTWFKRTRQQCKDSGK